jgi:hypothetical protein
VFVRRKRVKGNTYYQLVRNYREDGKHKQQFLCHLGPHKSLEAAIATERELAEHHERVAATHSEEAQISKELCLEEYAEEIEEMGGDFPSRRQAYLRQIRPLRGGRRGTDWQKYIVRRDKELELYYLINDHHYHRDIVRREKKWAATHRTQLNKFLEFKREYF